LPLLARWSASDWALPLRLLLGCRGAQPLFVRALSINEKSFSSSEDMLPVSAGGGGVVEVGVLVGSGTGISDGDGVGVSVAPVLAGSSVGATVGPVVGTPVGPAVGRRVGVFPGVGGWVGAGVPVVSSGVGVADGDGTGALVAATGSLDVVT
jgi:hypothetical protein